METKLLKGILKENVTMRVNEETIYIPAGNDVVFLVVFASPKKGQLNICPNCGNTSPPIFDIGGNKSCPECGASL
jgi:hypothetical protein